MFRRARPAQDLRLPGGRGEAAPAGSASLVHLDPEVFADQLAELRRVELAYMKARKGAVRPDKGGGGWQDSEGDPAVQQPPAVIGEGVGHRALLCERHGPGAVLTVDAE